MKRERLKLSLLTALRAQLKVISMYCTSLFEELSAWHATCTESCLQDSIMCRSSLAIGVIVALESRLLFVSSRKREELKGWGIRSDDRYFSRMILT